MVDKEALMDKIESGTFGIEDLEDYLTLFLEISNESEDIQEEVEGWNRVLQIKLSDTGVDSTGELSISLFDLSGNQISDTFFFDTFSSPEKAQIVFNFRMNIQ